jgi:hypothetical protein
MAARKKELSPVKIVFGKWLLWGWKRGTRTDNKKSLKA